MAISRVLHSKPLAQSYQWQRLAGSIGAVVEGLDLARADDTAFDHLRELITAHQVVFVRGQDFDAQTFADVGSRFGTLAVHPLHELLGREQTVSVIEDSPSRPPAGFPWHTDLSWLAAPPRFGFLHALQIPEFGGDTMWTSLTAAYRSLSPAMQELCRNVGVMHAIDPSFRDSVVRNHGEGVARALEAEHAPIVHPLVRRHPDTGEASLWLSPLYTRSIVDLLPAESEMLLRHLDALVEDPNLGVRWHWAEGDVAIWDESCTVHRALVDHHPQGRRMRRCTTSGDLIEPFLEPLIF